MSTTYEKDIIVWATEQAALLRPGKLSALDIEHIAEEIEDVGKSEKRELSSRMAVLLSHYLSGSIRRIVAARAGRAPSVIRGSVSRSP